MSAGGVFKLLASDGRSDRMIHATDLLNARIRDIMCQRRAHGLPDVTPTLADIERTHILFVNAHYKPFAALAYEYTKVRAQSGTIAWGGQILFSIPAYGEFFSDMVAHITLSAVSATAGRVPDLPLDFVGPDDPHLNESGTAKISSRSVDVGGIDAPTGNITTIYTHEYVNAAGDVLTPGNPAQNFVRYCEYPGEMLFKEVKFEINGNPLDAYTREATMFYRKFWILHDKQDGWKRLVGQEVPVDGYSNATSIAGANAFTAPMAGLTDQSGANSIVGTNAASITSRKVVQVVSGFQTPKLIQPEMHLWIPLLFWFNKDIRLAIPSVSIPYGQRFITVTLESQENVVYTAPSNIYLRLTVEQRTSVVDSSNIRQVVDVKRQILYEPVMIPESVVNSAQTMLAELYVNNIFVNPEIHDIYIRRIGFTLVRVHRLQKQQTTLTNDNVLLSQLKWPTELIYIGMLPTENIMASNPNKWRDWHNLTVVTDEILYNVNRSSGQVDPVDPYVHAAILAIANSSVGETLPTPVPTPFSDTYPNYTLPTPPVPRTFSSFDAFEQIDVPKYRETIQSLKVTVQGNDIIDTFSTPFFRDYTPWYYGQNIMRTPVDLGALLINFCVYPGHYQPSGHINISRAREFYVQYMSDYCGTSTPCEFIALGIALNFLLISDGSAVLRFTS